MNPFVWLDSNNQFIPGSTPRKNIPSNIFVLNSNLSKLNYIHGFMLFKNFVQTSTFLSFRAFPAFIRNGTPSHLSLLIWSKAAANVGEVEPAGT